MSRSGRLEQRLARAAPEIARRAARRMRGDRRLRRVDPRERKHVTPPVRAGAATSALFDRLGDDAVAEMERRLEGEDARLWRNRTTPDFPWWCLIVGVAGHEALALAFALSHGVPGVEQRTGLRAVMPPDEVESMARGSFATGGSYYYADLIAEALAEAGAELGDGSAALDFGCSSERVVRVCRAAWPRVRWHGAEPNASALAWAQSNLGDLAELIVSPQAPPLPYEDSQFDLVAAISIWSHYGERYARAWLEEMHRVIRPGGHLLMTVHGFNSLAFFQITEQRPLGKLSEIGAALVHRGFWFQTDPGWRGAGGVADPQWGTTFLTLEWLLALAQSGWRLSWFAAGRAQGNQDAILLERV